MCRTVLQPGAEDDAGRAKYQIAVTRCADCKRAWQDGAGAVIEIDEAAAEMAECDAQRIGSLDAEEPERAAQDIPPATRRLVHRRDHGRCVVPGCRASRNIDIHHLKHREHGGDHAPGNLCLLCSGHHQAHHEGRLMISGVAPDVECEHVEPIRPAPMDHRDAAQVRAALVNLGFRPHEASIAVGRACAHVGTTETFNELLRAALQQSSRPRGTTTTRAHVGTDDPAHVGTENDEPEP